MSKGVGKSHCAQDCQFDRFDLQWCQIGGVPRVEAGIAAGPM
jgi:hypothetical protein